MHNWLRRRLDITSFLTSPDRIGAILGRTTFNSITMTKLLSWKRNLGRRKLKRSPRVLKVIKHWDQRALTLLSLRGAGTSCRKTFSRPYHHQRSQCTSITVIPRREGSKKSHYRPISLVGCLYKFSAKLLVNRLKVVLQKWLGRHEGSSLLIDKFLMMFWC